MAVANSVLITGGNRGIGQQLARDLALAGWDVLIAGRDRGKADADAAMLIPAARTEVARLAPGLAVQSIRTLDTLVADSLAFREVQTTLVSAFGLLVLALAAVGIYGVLSYSVAERRMEVGVRMALGATAGDVLRMVLGQGMALAGLGLGLGIVAALALTRLMATMLYSVDSSDPVVYLSITALLAVAAALACWIPSRRAARVDPASALRGA